MRPTVLDGVTPDMVIMQDEISGPVAPVMKVSGFDEAMAVVSNSRYGLSACLFTHDYRRIMQAVAGIRFGESPSHCRLCATPVVLGH